MDYLGIHYDETEIQHWKYIRKYKSKSGKTVYVYADKKTHSNIKKQASDATKSASESSYNRRKSAERYRAAASGTSLNPSDDARMGTVYADRANRQAINADRSWRRATALMRKYSLQGIALSKIQEARRSIAKAKSWLNNLFK